MTKQSLTYQLIAELLQNLEAAGFTYGVGQHLAMQRLLNQLPTDIAPEDLAPIFAPLLCKNEKEQQQFEDIFAASWERVQAVNTPVPILEPQKNSSRKWKKWLWILGIPMAIALAYLLWETTKEIVQPERPKVLKMIPFGISPDSTRTIKIPTDELEDFAPIIKVGIGIDSLQSTATTTYGAYQVIDTMVVQFKANTLQGRDSMEVFLYDSLGYCAKVLLHSRIEKITSDINNQEVDKLPDQEVFISKNITWLKVLFLLLSVVLLWIILKYRDSKRRKLVTEREAKGLPPYIWNIKIPDVEDIVLSEAYYSVLSKLRQRTSDEHARLDIPETIKATIENAGMVDFRYRQMTRPPEYLLLIDQQSGSNHRAHLFDYLYRLFQAEEIIIARFFYDGDPRLCYNEAFPEGITLKELQHHYYNARLLLVSNGYSLLSPLSGQLAKWTVLFSPWKERSLLSPRPTDTWGTRETQLESLFHLLPASLQGLDFLVSELDAGEDANFSDWKNKIKDAPREAIQLEGGLWATLEAQYSEEMLQWIAACAVYPALHWDLTLFLGQLLSKTGNSLLSVANIMDLSRLPWFVQGEIPKEVRVLLLSWLEEKQPALLQNIREQLHQVLQQNQPPKDSVAWEDYSMNSTLNEWLICQEPKRKKELEKEIAQKLEAGIEADFTVVKYLDRKRTLLDFIVPDSWKKCLHHGGHVGLGMKNFWKDVFYFALPTLLFLIALVLNYSDSIDKTTSYVIIKARPMGNYELPNQGEIIINFGNETLVKKINSQGEVYFPEIFNAYFDEKSKVTITFHASEDEPFKSVYPDSLYQLKPTSTIDLWVELTGLDKMHGIVKDFKTGNPLSEVRVSILNLETFTDKNGWFELKIPPTQQRKFHTIKVTKQGYKTYEQQNVPPHTDQEIRILMKQ